MSDVRQIGDTDRLPWLEPYSDRPRERAQPAPTPAAPRQPKDRNGNGYVRVPTWLFLLLGALALGVAGYVIGRGAKPDSGQSVTTELPQPTLPYHSLDALANEQEPPPPPSLDEVANGSSVTPAPITTPKAPAVRKAKPIVRKPVAARPKAAPKRNPVTRVSPKPVERPRFVLRYSPPPTAGRPGQVIEIGRYTDPRIADAMWRRAVWRYPYLGKLSKVVTPTPAANRRQVYALRLGTGSRSHARTLCRNLVSIGYPCAVV